MIIVSYLQVGGKPLCETSWTAPLVPVVVETDAKVAVSVLVLDVIRVEHIAKNTDDCYSYVEKEKA